LFLQTVDWEAGKTDNGHTYIMIQKYFSQALWWIIQLKSNKNTLLDMS